MLADEFREDVLFRRIREKLRELWRKAMATTCSEGGIPERMARIQKWQL